METVIGIIVIVLSLVFKVVEKKLKDAGKPVNSGGVPPRRPRPVSPEPFAGPFSESFAKPFAEREVLVPEPVAVEKAVRSRTVGKAVQTEQKPKTKPDPKKLIVYSEIMKPKYTEL